MSDFITGDFKLPKFNFSKEMTPERLKELSKPIEFKRLPEGIQKLKIINIDLKGQNENNPSWFGISIKLTTPEVKKTKLVEREKDGKTYKVMEAFDKSGNELPTINHYVLVPTQTVLFKTKSGKETSAVWLKTLNFLSGLGLEIFDVKDVAKVFSSTKALAKLKGQIVEGNLGYEGNHIIKNDDDTYTIVTKTGQPLMLNPQHGENKFSSKDMAEGICAMEQLPLKPYLKILDFILPKTEAKETEIAEEQDFDVGDDVSDDWD